MPRIVGSPTFFPPIPNPFYKPLMKELDYDPNNNSTDIETPEGIGNVACAAVLESAITTNRISLATCNGQTNKTEAWSLAP